MLNDETIPALLYCKDTDGSSNILVISPTLLQISAQLHVELARGSFHELSVQVQWNKVDKNAIIRIRYIRIPHPALKTKRERDTYN